MKTVLIIDDEASMRQLLKDCLNKLGYRVHEAKDGWEGIRMINDQGKYDAVLTDIKMPEITGIDIAYHIKKTKISHTPVIAITGFYFPDESNLFNYILKKPFNLKELDTVLKNLIT